MEHRKLVAGVVAVAGLIGVGGVLAQPGGCGAEGRQAMKAGMMRDGGGQMAGMRDPGARVEQRLTKLKDELKLTTQQEPLWAAFAEKSRAEAEKGAKAMRERMGSDKAVTAPERMAQMQGMMRERLSSMEAVNQSFSRLYSALTPDQKAVADKQFAMGPGKHGRGHGGARQRPDGATPQGGPEPRKG